MPIALEVTLIVVLAALTVSLVPLLLQLRRTAKELDVFLLSSRKDLTQIAADIHASMLRVDHLIGSLQTSADELSTFAHSVGEVGRAVNDVHNRFHSAMESASQNLGGIIGGISTVLTFFKSKQTHHNPEPERDS